MNTRSLLLSSLLAACGPAFAGALGTGVIEGSVVGSSGAVLSSGVRIAIRCGAVTRSAAPDRAGHFVVDGLPEGTCTITSSGAGFETLTLQVTVAAGSISTVLVGMHPPLPPPPMTVATPAAAMPEGIVAEPAPPPRRAPAPAPRAVDAKPAERLRKSAAASPLAPSSCPCSARSSIPRPMPGP